MNQVPIKEQYHAFLSDLEQRINTTEFQDETAKHFWEKGKKWALRDLGLLKTVAQQMSFQDEQMLTDSLFLSTELLSWAKESGCELSYAESLTSSAISLFERLQYTYLIPQEKP